MIRKKKRGVFTNETIARQTLCFTSKWARAPSGTEQVKCPAGNGMFSFGVVGYSTVTLAVIRPFVLGDDQLVEETRAVPALMAFGDTIEALRKYAFVELALRNITKRCTKGFT